MTQIVNASAPEMHRQTVEEDVESPDSSAPIESIDRSLFIGRVRDKLGPSRRSKRHVETLAGEIADVINSTAAGTLEVGRLAYELQLEANKTATEIADAICHAGAERMPYSKSWITRLINQAALLDEHPVDKFPIIHSINDAERRCMLTRIPENHREGILRTGIITPEHFRGLPTEDKVKQVFGAKREINIANDPRAELGKVISLFTGKGGGNKKPPTARPGGSGSPQRNLREDLMALAEFLAEIGKRCEEQGVLDEFTPEGDRSFSNLARHIRKAVRSEFGSVGAQSTKH